MYTETAITTEMYVSILRRNWTVTAERSAKCVIVYLCTLNGGIEERARWLPPLSVSVKADVLLQLDWSPVNVIPSASNGDEWEIDTKDDWVSITVDMDTQQWFDEDACSRVINLTASSDVVFVFGKRELYCDRKILSAASSFFSNLFQYTVKEGNAHRVVMGEADYTDHLALFLLIHREKYRITDRNVEIIIKLADKYDIPGLEFDAFSQLVVSRTIPSMDKLRLSELTCNEKYVDEVIAKMEDWDGVSREASFPFLTNATRIKVLERAVRMLHAKLDKVVYSCSGGCRSRINQIDPSQFS